MIQLVVGPPGAGKGLFLIRVVADLLIDTKLTVVTNFAVRLGELSRWCDASGYDVGDLQGRIYTLTDEEIKTFYLVRGAGRHIVPAKEEEVRQNVFQDYGPANGWPSVAYVIDEADLHFGSREYKEHGRQINFYNKQHRKLGDTVYYCCQSPAQIDKLFREVTEATIVLKNLGNRSLGIFRLPSLFMWSRFYRVPTGMATAESQGVFRMPIRSVTRAGSRLALEACFDTAAGVGMSGIDADKNRKRKGWSLGWILMPILGMLVLTWYYPRIIAWGLGHATQMPGAVAKGLVPGSSAVTTEAAGHGVGVVVKHPELVTTGKDESARVDDIYLTGVVLWRGKATVYLSDGRVYDPTDRHLQYVSDRLVVIDGKVFKFKNGGAVTAGNTHANSY